MHFYTNKMLCIFVKCRTKQFTALETYNTDFDEIIIVFTDQNGRTSKIEGKVDLALLINK